MLPSFLRPTANIIAFIILLNPFRKALYDCKHKCCMQIKDTIFIQTASKQQTQRKTFQKNHILLFLVHTQTALEQTFMYNAARASILKDHLFFLILIIVRCRSEDERHLNIVCQTKYILAKEIVAFKYCSTIELYRKFYWL